jgi:methylase of polypeptide subunit release factors
MNQKTAEKSDRPLQVSATDMSEDALTLAQENTQIKNTQITFLQGDLLQPLMAYF